MKEAGTLFFLFLTCRTWKSVNLESFHKAVDNTFGYIDTWNLQLLCVDVFVCVYMYIRTHIHTLLSELVIILLFKMSDYSNSYPWEESSRQKSKEVFCSLQKCKHMWMRILEVKHDYRTADWNQKSKKVMIIQFLCNWIHCVQRVFFNNCGYITLLNQRY